MLIGLFSFPFLIFQIPFLAEAFVHTRPTGYDCAGKVRPMMSPGDMDKVYAKRKVELANRKRQVANGEGPPLSLRERIYFAWNDVIDGCCSVLCAKDGNTLASIANGSKPPESGILKSDKPADGGSPSKSVTQQARECLL